VEILFMGWNFEDDTLIDFARKARAVQEDEALFKEIEEAGTPRGRRSPPGGMNPAPVEQEQAG
jgi:hypothetical protein